MIFFLSSACLPGRAVGSNRNERCEYLTNFITIHRCQYLEEKYFGKKRSMDLKRVHSMLSVSIECVPFPKICVLVDLLKEIFQSLKCVCCDGKRLELSIHNWFIALICNTSCLLFVVCLCYFFFTIDALMLDMHGFH